MNIFFIYIYYLIIVFFKKFSNFIITNKVALFLINILFIIYSGIF